MPGENLNAVRDAAGPGSIARDIIEQSEALTKLDVVELTDPRSGHEALVAFVPRGRTPVDLTNILDAHLPRPRRARGTITAQDEVSFIQLVNAFKDGNTRVFARLDPDKPSVLAVLDHHENDGGTGEVKEGADPYHRVAARYGSHRVQYDCDVSEEWTEWADRDGKQMSQRDFAEFLENRIGDVVQPEGEQAVLAENVARSLSARIGGPSNVMALSRGLEVNVGVKVASVVTLATGEIKMLHEETHSDVNGQPITSPNLFFINIPVFFNGPRYLIAVRLRYRAQNGVVTWFYQMHRPDVAADHAFREIVERVRADTGVMTVLGAPENAKSE